MTRAELASYYPSVAGFPPPAQIWRPSYAVVTRAWVEGPFRDFYRRRLFDDNVPIWRPDWVCQEYALAGVLLSRVCWANTRAHDPGVTAPAVGSFFFHPDAFALGLDHAVNPIFTEESMLDGMPDYYDLQNFTRWPMSHTEFVSRSHVEF